MVAAVMPSCVNPGFVGPLLPGATLETEPVRCGPVPAAVEPAREGPKQALKVLVRGTWNLQAPTRPHRPAGGHNTIQPVHDPRFDYSYSVQGAPVPGGGCRAMVAIAAIG